MPNPKKPVELANKLGNPGHRAAGDVLEVAQPVTALPVPPRDLRAAGVELFERVARAAAHWVSESDLPALENLCRLQDQYADNKKRMELAEDDETFLRYSLECRKLLEVQRGFYADLGLNPTSRGKLGLTVAATKEIKSKLDRWMR